ncbi:MAG: hypothetical protein A2X82_16965 [Geobacteraceae bacterium GWC2_55_20]|nr:MAG: hypothetical protein A2X82_16965 [Geobacteraceae bacterium GWC2_55_20]HCE69075.1 hypothetical protein [Geobacter sp.]
MFRQIVLGLTVIICFLTSGCIGKYIAALGPPRTIILRDITEANELTNKPKYSIRVNMLTDERLKQEFIGKVYSNMGEHVKDLQLHDGRTLDKALSFIIAGSLSRDGYDVVINNNDTSKPVAYEISGVIKSFELTEKSSRPNAYNSLHSESKRPITTYNYGVKSTGLSYLELSIFEVATDKKHIKIIDIYYEADGITAQEMATKVTTGILNRFKVIMRDVTYNSSLPSK